MHKEVIDFLEGVKEKFPDKFNSCDVLEFGSLNINGSPRGLFKDCNYTGVDWRPGLNVDVVSLAHEFIYGFSVDVVISCEMLEHDKYAKRSIHNMITSLRPKGLLILTMASSERPIHEVFCGVDNFYSNIDTNRLMQWISLELFKEFHCINTGKDLYFWGIVK